MFIFILLAFDFLAVCLQGFALKLLWGWFMVPGLGLPTLPWVQAMGVAILANLLTSQHIPRDESKWRELVAHNISMPVVFLIFGWIAHLFM